MQAACFGVGNASHLPVLGRLPFAVAVKNTTLRPRNASYEIYRRTPPIRFCRRTRRTLANGESYLACAPTFGISVTCSPKYLSRGTLCGRPGPSSWPSRK
ncbi:hypothetical protein PsYK624_006680 [Phanerochaete sordida]|uniref:Uncharacterized protein n=1 Tax=Phanerochaete sordida TaxID=48140 RepID=A0A9P3FWX4_9APHY|nr:hypothetical protein PsYK624_006680 [Phanerochaete sordida]